MTASDRNGTLFNLRYAARVHERYGRMWRRVNGAVRVVALLAGSGAIAALSAQLGGAALAAGVLFALCQAVDFGLNPAAQAASSMQQRKAYARLGGRAAGLDDGALEVEFLALHAEDDVVVPDVLRRLAYNDVAVERATVEEAEAMQASLYPVGRLEKLVSFFA